jgi:aryl-alcohol dehydrogenase-like predicted oxidoreductase
MSLPDKAYYQFTPDLRICRVLNGMWQVSGAHGTIDPQRALTDMAAYHSAGFTTWDLADHYGPAEIFIGQFRQALAAREGEGALVNIQAFTKWVPRPAKMTRAIVEENINRSLKRMGVTTLDLLQFHWWDYNDNSYLDALRHLADLRDEGKIRHLALTNFDTRHLEIIVRHGIKIVSNQVQFSLVDMRPEIKMAKFCQENGIVLFTYGTVCGGLLSEKYLNQAEPRTNSLTTASLRKYKQMIDAWGGWTLFQELLNVLHSIAQKYSVSMANVAVRYILDRPAVGGVIVGARLGVAQHLTDNARVFSFELDNEDKTRIAAVQTKANDLFKTIGDCGDEYRW